MKNRLCATITAVLLAGCSTADINRISNDVVNGATQTVLASAGLNQGQGAPAGGTVQQPSRTGSGSYSVGRERLHARTARRTSRDYGSIQLVRTEKNPQNRTVLTMDSCAHPGLGRVPCMGYIFAVTPEGWLVDDSIHFGVPHTSIQLAAGTYYFKIENHTGSGPSYYTTGEFVVTPLLTNYVSLQLE